MAGEEDELVPEEVAEEAHEAFMTYQNAKSKYREALKGRGADVAEIKKRSEERLRLAKQRSFCSACKRKGHWHKDPECPLRGRRPDAGESSQNVQMTVHSAQTCTDVHSCFVTAYEATADHDFITGGLLAIVDTACTKTVAGYPWFERFCDMCDTLGHEVKTYDHEEFFKFGASRIHTSHFGVDAWFSIRGRWFGVKVAIVPCSAPLLLSRPILAALGMHYDLAGQRVKLNALSLEDIPLCTSETGHPALVVNEYEGKKPPSSDRFVSDIHLPPSGAYMSAQSSESMALKPLFYPKVLSHEVHNMLTFKETLGSAGYFCWWKRAKLSRDFWIETEEEFIRVHVVPRRGRFDPSTWQTRLLGLKEILLKRLNGDRITEAICCLSEGTQVSKHYDDSYKVNSVILEHPRIGRSRFHKFKICVDSEATSGAPPDGLNAQLGPIAMEHEEGAAPCRTSGARSDSPHIVDGAGAQVHPCGTTPTQEAYITGAGPAQGADQDDTAAAGGRCGGRWSGAAGEADSRLDDETPSGCKFHAGEHSDAVRPLQGLDVPGSPRGLHQLGSERGQGQSQCPRRLGQVCHVGSPGVGAQVNGIGHGHEEERHGSRPGGLGIGPTTSDPERQGPFKFLGHLVEQGLESVGISPAAQGGRHGLGHGHRGRAGAPGGPSREDPSAGESVGVPQEADQGPRDQEDGRQVRGPTLCRRGGEIKYDSGANNMVYGETGEDDDAGDEDVAENYDPGAITMRETDHGLDSATSDGGRRQNEFNIGAINIQENVNGLMEDTDNETTSGSEDNRSRSPVARGVEAKARAQAGMRRRRHMNRSTRQKIMDSAHAAFNVLFTVSLAMGSWAQEVMGDPLWDAWAVLQPRRPHGVEERADCLELFAGSAHLSGAFAKKQRAVLQPRDLRYDYDLKKAGVQEEVIEDLWTHKPRLVWMAPPCTSWCQFSHLNYSTQELRRKRDRERSLLMFVRRVFELQDTLGGVAVIENPRSSAMWRESPVAQLVGRRTVCFADLDLCQYGLTSVFEDTPLRKPLSLMTNNHHFAYHMTKKCDGGHEHRPIQGRDTAASAIYPPPFAKAVIRALDYVEQNKKTTLHFPTQHLPGPGPEQQGDPRGSEAISFKGKVKPMVASTLKRIHQNLGRPPNRGLVRRLKMGGADEAIIRAAEQMTCRTCEKSSKAKTSRPAQPAVVLDFNEVVAVDVIWLDTVESAGLPALNIVDVASTYQVVASLNNTTAEELGRALIEHWINWAGAPKHLLCDLDSAFKGHFLQLMNERSVIVRCAAGQAHWQNGIAERHGGAWKEVWNKLVEDNAVLDNEVVEAIAATSDAKNQLRNKSGYSPRQWVFGTNMRMAGDLFDRPEEMSALDHITADEKLGRRHQIKMAARAAFFQCQTKEALARAIAHKTRVEERSFNPGELVYAYREYMGKKRWLSPCSVIGREGHNYWLARGGRCLLCAPEHLRSAQHEEINEGLRLKMAMKELQKLMGPMDPVEQRARAIQAAARKAHVLDDVPISIKRSRVRQQSQVHQPFFMKRVLSAKAQEKQLDKELPWHAIPEEERQLYIDAEEKQWKEHVQYEAVQPLSLAESDEVRKTVKPERILNSRFLYRDKNRAKRRMDKKIGPKAKARLCVAGQYDPDLGRIDMSTDAPTVFRHSIILALQLALARKWRVGVGDIRAAFLNGLPAPRGLYFRQPKRGIPGLQPGQLIEVLKGVFGLSTSPKLWWMKLSKDLLNLEVESDEKKFHFVQNPMDPCAFMIVGEEKETKGLLLTHVDDIMVMASPDLLTVV